MSLKSRAERIVRDLDEARRVLAIFDVVVICDLLRRAQCSHVPDGYPVSSRGSEVHGGSSEWAVLDTATARIRYDQVQCLMAEREQAMEAGDVQRARMLDRQIAEIGHVEPDPIGDDIEEIFGTLTEITGGAKRVNRLYQVVVHAGDALKGRPSTVDHCRACERVVAGTTADRLRSGYCSGCYSAWIRDGRPDRLRFERARREELQARGDRESVLPPT